jgi:hypothetical protein
VSAGTIVGGWEYVYAAYALTALILTGYAVSVVVRHRQERARRDIPDSAFVPGASEPADDRPA